MPPPVSPTHVAYLVAHYPAVSHTFIDREIGGLRARGVRIDTLSVRPAAEADLLTEEDRRAARETFTILPPRPLRFARAHARALARDASAYAGTLVAALRMGGRSPRDTLWQLFYFAEAILAWDELDRRGIRHVHAHFANVATAIAMLAARYGGLSWSFTMHGPTEFDDVTRYALADKVRAASFVAVIGHYARSQLMKLVEPEHWEKLRIVRCGVDTERFAPVDRGDRPAHAPLEVLCVGRLVPDKGQGILLEALAALRAGGTDARLTLVGDGPDRAGLEARTRELGLDGAVTFTGSVGQDRIRDHYAAADVFCLPSFAEGIPVVLMEAMATGLPVVTTQIMGIPELVADMLVPPGDVAALHDALAALAADPARRAALGEAGRARVVEAFRIEDAAAALEPLLRAAAGAR